MKFILLSLCLSLLTFSATAEVTTPFNGKNLNGWKTKGPAEKSKWTVGHPVMGKSNPKALELGEGGKDLAMVNLAGSHGKSIDFYSEATFGSCTIELDLMVPKDSNSGIYVMGEYEVQVLDSFGKEKMGMGDMGAIYGAAPPSMNACKAPGEWQHFVINFVAPTFDGAGKKLTNATFTRITLNGKVIQENAEMPKPTPGGVSGKEAAKGPIMFQGDHGPVAYRNIKITEK
ncbi:MAG: hypothetical protein ACI9TH_002942 [Kiritimatiellia bacterium]|jgi:hypothetical protein